ncbi:hypothetical protein [Kitasatospora sp. NPDC093102]|uniref:hypothetical protein n=1 Tax=Kitasatospora sp. NPDC093102 TaxID=3155069 RepID=UPI003422F8A2
MSVAPVVWFSGLFRFGSSGRDLPSWWAALMGAVSGASYPKVDAEGLLAGAAGLRRAAVAVDGAGVGVERFATALPAGLPGAGEGMAGALAGVGESTRGGAASLREGAGALEEQAGQVDYAQRSMELTAAVTLWTVAQLVWAMAATAGVSGVSVAGVLAGGRRSVSEFAATLFDSLKSGAVFGVVQETLVQASQLGEYRRELDVTSLLVAGVGGLAGGLGDPVGHALGGRLPVPGLLRKMAGGALGGVIGGEAGAVVSTAWQGGEWDPTMLGLAAAAGAGTGVIGGALHHYTQLGHAQNPHLRQDPVDVHGTDHWTAPAAHDRQPAAELPPPALTGTPEPVSREATAPAPRESGVAQPEAGRATVERPGRDVEAAVSSTASVARLGGPDPVSAESDVSVTPTRPVAPTTGDHPAHEHAVRTADTPVRPLEPLYDRRDWRSHQRNWLEAVDKAQKNPLVREVQTIPADRLHTWWNALPELHRQHLEIGLNTVLAPADRPAPAAKVPEPAAVVKLRAAFAGELATHRLTDPHTTTDQILDRTPGHPTNRPATPDDHSRQTFLHAAGLQATAADRRAGILPGGARTKESILEQRRAAAASAATTTGSTSVTPGAPAAAAPGRPVAQLKRRLASPSGSDPQPRTEAPGKRARGNEPVRSVIEGSPITVPTKQAITTALTQLAQELKDRGVHALRNATLLQLARYTLPGTDPTQLHKAAHTTLSMRPDEPLTTTSLQLGHTLDQLLTDPAHTTAPWKPRALHYADFLDRHHLPLDAHHLDTLHTLHRLTRAPRTTTTAHLDHLVTTVNPAISTPSPVDRARLVTDALALRHDNHPVTIDTLTHATDQRLAHAMDWTPASADHTPDATHPDHSPDTTTHVSDSTHVSDEAIRFAITLMKERGDLPFKDGIPETEDPTARTIANYYDISYKVLASTTAAEAAATTHAAQIATPHHTPTTDGPAAPPSPPATFLPKDPTVRTAYEELLAVLHEENRRDQIPRQLRAHAATLPQAPHDSVYRGWNPKNEATPAFSTHYKTVKHIDAKTILLKSKNSHKDDYWARTTAAACLLADNATPATVITKRLAVARGFPLELVKHAPSQHPWTPEEATRLVQDWIDNHQNSVTLLAHLQANTPYAPVIHSSGRIDHPKFAHPVFVGAKEQLRTIAPALSKLDIAAKLGVSADPLDIWKKEAPDVGEEPAVLEDTSTNPVPFQPRVVLPTDGGVRTAYEELLAVLHEEHPDQVPRQLRAHAATLPKAPHDSVYRGWNPKNETTPTLIAHYRTVKHIDAKVNLLRIGLHEEYNPKVTAAACLLADNGTQKGVSVKRLGIGQKTLPDLVEHAPSRHPWTPEEAGRLVRDWIDNHQNSTTLLAHLQATTPYVPVVRKDGLDHPKFARPVFLHADARLRTTRPELDLNGRARKLDIDPGRLANWVAGAAAGEDHAAPDDPARARDAADAHDTPPRRTDGGTSDTPEATGPSDRTVAGPADSRSESAGTDHAASEGTGSTDLPTADPMAVDGAEESDPGPSTARPTGSDHRPTAAGHETPTLDSPDPTPFQPRLILPRDKGVRTAYEELLAVLHENHRDQIPRQLRAHAATLPQAPRDSVFRGWNPKDERTPDFDAHFRRARRIPENSTHPKKVHAEYGPKRTAAACLLTDNGTKPAVIAKRLAISVGTLRGLAQHAPSQHPWTPEEAARLVQDWITHHRNTTTLLAHLQANTPYTLVEQGPNRFAHPPFAHPVFLDADARLRAGEPGLSQNARARKLGVPRTAFEKWDGGTAAVRQTPATPVDPARAGTAADGPSTPTHTRAEAIRPDAATEPMDVDGGEESDAGPSMARPAASDHRPTAADHETPTLDSPDPTPFQPRLILPRDKGVRTAYEELLAVLHEEHPDQIPRQLRAHAATLPQAPRDSVYRGWNPKDETPNFRTHYKKAAGSRNPHLLRDGLLDEYGLRAAAAACLLTDSGVPSNVMLKHLGVAKEHLPGLTKDAPSRHPWTPEEAARLVRDWITHHQNSVTLLAHLQANTPYTPVIHSSGRVDHPTFARPVFLDAYVLLRTTTPTLADIAEKLGAASSPLGKWVGEMDGPARRATPTDPDGAEITRPTDDGPLPTASDSPSTPHPEASLPLPSGTTEPMVLEVAEDGETGPFVPRVVLPEDSRVRTAYDELLAVLQENRPDQVPRQLRAHAATLAPAPRDSVFRGWNPESEALNFQTHYKTVKRITGKPPLLKDGLDGDYGPRLAAAGCLLADNATTAEAITKRLGLRDKQATADIVGHAPSRHPWTPEEAARLVKDWITHHRNTTTLLAHLQANTPYAPTMDKNGHLEHPKFARTVFLHADAELRSANNELIQAKRAKELGVPSRTLYGWENPESSGGRNPASGARSGRLPRADAVVSTGVTPARASAEQRFGVRKEPARVQVGAPRATTGPTLHGTAARHLVGARRPESTGDRPGNFPAAKASRRPQASPVSSGTAAPGPKPASVFRAAPPPARTPDTVTSAPARDAVDPGSAPAALGHLALPAGGTPGTLPVITPAAPDGETVITDHGRTGSGRTTSFDEADVYPPDVRELFGEDDYGLEPLALDREIPSALTSGVVELLASTSLTDPGDTPRPASPVRTTDTHAEAEHVPEEHTAESSSPVIPTGPDEWDTWMLDELFPEAEALDTLTVLAGTGDGEDAPEITPEDLEEMGLLISAYPAPTPPTAVVTDPPPAPPTAVVTDPPPAPPTVTVESSAPPAALKDTTTDSETGFADKVTIPKGGFPPETAPSPLYYPDSPPAHDDAEPTSTTKNTLATDETMDITMDTATARETTTPPPSASTGPAPTGTAPNTPLYDANPFDLAFYDVFEDQSAVPTIAELADKELDRLIDLHDDPDAEWRGRQTDDTGLSESGTGFATDLVVPGITHPLNTTDTTNTADTEMTDADPYPAYIGTPPPAPRTPTTTSPPAMTLPLTDLPEF